MLGAELASCWLKIGRAEEHLQTLKNEIRQWTEADPYAVIPKHDDKGSRYTVFLEIRIKPDVDRFSLITGDCIHNLRSALDHLVYAVGVHFAGGAEPPDARRLQFPICDTPDDFANQLWRIRSLPGRVQAEIERAQPYNRTDPQLPSVLALLRDLDDFDKHRLLSFHASMMHQSRIHHVRCPHPIQRHTFSITLETGDLIDGAEVATLSIDPPCLNVKFEYEMAVCIVLSPAARPFQFLTDAPGVLEFISKGVRGIVEDVGRSVV